MIRGPLDYARKTPQGLPEASGVQNGPTSLNGLGNPVRKRLVKAPQSRALQVSLSATTAALPWSGWDPEIRPRPDRRRSVGQCTWRFPARRMAASPSSDARSRASVARARAPISRAPDGADRFLDRDFGVMGARASSLRCRPARACYARIGAAVQVNVSAMKRRVIFACTGVHPIWLPDSTRVVFSTERDLASLPGSSKHKVWVAHLALYDYATGTVRLLTSGVSNNEEPTLCR